MAATILIVEDEEDLRTLLGYNLEAKDYVVNSASCEEEASQSIHEKLPDLILLDWMLPGTSGIELCRRWRANRVTTNIPIIMLTARGEETERVRGLATGADDYIVKPFSMPELLARIKAILRRVNPSSVATILKEGELELDRSTHRVMRSGREIHLGPTEYRLLEYLMSKPGRVRLRQQLLDNVWGTENFVDERTVDVHIGRLRKSLSRRNEKDPIRTVRGSGYAFDEKFGR